MNFKVPHQLYNYVNDFRKCFVSEEFFCYGQLVFLYTVSIYIVPYRTYLIRISEMLATILKQSRIKIKPNVSRHIFSLKSAEKADPDPTKFFLLSPNLEVDELKITLLKVLGLRFERMEHTIVVGKKQEHFIPSRWNYPAAAFLGSGFTSDRSGTARKRRREDKKRPRKNDNLAGWTDKNDFSKIADIIHATVSLHLRFFLSSFPLLLSYKVSFRHRRQKDPSQSEVDTSTLEK